MEVFENPASSGAKRASKPVNEAVQTLRNNTGFLRKWCKKSEENRGFSGFLVVYLAAFWLPCGFCLWSKSRGAPTSLGVLVVSLSSHPKGVPKFGAVWGMWGKHLAISRSAAAALAKRTWVRKFGLELSALGRKYMAQLPTDPCGCGSK